MIVLATYQFLDVLHSFKSHTDTIYVYLHRFRPQIYCFKVIKQEKNARTIMAKNFFCVFTHFSSTSKRIATTNTFMQPPVVRIRDDLLSAVDKVIELAGL